MDLLILVFATHQAVAIWAYSPLFAGVRAMLEIGGLPPWIPERVRDWLTRLLLCHWCLSVHVAFALAGIYFASDWLVRYVPGLSLAAVSLLGKWVIYALAVSRAANLLSDVWRIIDRTPGKEGHN